MSVRLSPKVKCQVCFQRFRSLAGHLKKHSYNAKRYKEEFNAPIVSPLTLRRMKLARIKRLLLKDKYRKDKRLHGYKSETALKIALSKIGKKRPPEVGEKISKALLGMKFTEEHKLAISASLMGHKVSDATRAKLRQLKPTAAHRKSASEKQIAEKGNAWKGGVSRYIYFGKKKFRLKRIFGDPLRCFFPGCDKVEGKTIKSMDCHHLDGNHENNPLDGMNWVPLCRQHHMLVDGRLRGSTPEEAAAAQQQIQRVHKEYMAKNYIGEVKSYYS